MDLIFGLILVLVACFGLVVGGLAAVHFAEWLDKHGPKCWPGRY